MSEPLPVVWLVRHGETAWTVSRQHTGLTDLPLTDQGEADARKLGQHLRHIQPDHVVTSPLQRAARTCLLAGFTANEVDRDLVEWDYGDFEGLTSAQIRTTHPQWLLWRDGCPGGESVAAVGARADRVIGRLRARGGNTVVFSSGHFMRVLAARWLGQEPAAGRLLLLGTTTLSVLGYEHNLQEPVIRLWNDARPGSD